MGQEEEECDAQAVQRTSAPPHDVQISLDRVPPRSEEEFLDVTVWLCVTEGPGVGGAVDLFIHALGPT